MTPSEFKPAGRLGRAIWLALVLLLIAPLPASASWVTFAGGTPLAGRNIQRMLQDREGRIWFGTQYGVAMLDGASWRTFDVTDGMPDIDVVELLEDSSGGIWAGGFRGLARFDGRLWRSYTDELPHPVVNALLEDRNGNIWVGTALGVSRFDGNAWLHFTPEDGIGGSFVTALLEDRQGNIWAGTTSGVGRFDGTAWHPTGNFRVNRLLEDRIGQIWVATYSSGIAYFDGTRWRSYTTAHGLASNSVLSLLEDREGNIWAGHGDGAGVSRFDRTAWRTYGAESGLGAGDATALVTDDRGGVWVATSAGGASRFDGTWTTYDAPQALASNSALSLMGDRSGGIWVGTSAGGASRFDGTTWTVYEEADGLSPNGARAIAEDRAGAIWVATYEGARRFDGRTWQTFSMANGLGANNVWDILASSDGAVWIGTIDGGVSRFDSTGWTTYTTADNLANNSVYQLLEDIRGHIWAATGYGVSRFDGQWQSWIDVQGLSFGDITVLANGRNGSVFVGAQAGLAEYDGAQWTLYYFPFPIGILGVVAITEDEDGNPWIGTVGHGVGRFVPGVGWHFYTTADGLVSNDVRALFTDHEGGVWAGTYENGMSRFDGTSWRVHGSQDGLNSDWALPLFEDRSHGLWAGTRLGASRYNGLWWRDFSASNEAGPRGTLDMLETASGDLWFVSGQPGGVAHHSPDRVPPAMAFLACPSGVSATAIPTIVWAAGFGDDSTIRSSYSLDGAGPTPWSLATTWPARALEDGPHTFQVWGRDDMGNVSPVPAHCEFDIDATPPAPVISFPVFRQAVRDSVVIRGTTLDLRFKDYRLEIRPASLDTWTGPSVIEIARADTSVSVDGVLGGFDTRALGVTLGGDGPYDLRLAVGDTLGLTGFATTRIVIDNEPPYADVTSPVEVMAAEGGDVFTTHREAHLYLPPHALSGNAEVSIEDVKDSVQALPLPAGASVVGPAYQVSWQERILVKPGVLDFAVPEGLRGVPLTVWKLNSEQLWEYLGGTLDPETGRVSVLLPEAGVFGLIGGASPQVQPGESSPLSLVPRVFSPTGASSSAGRDYLPQSIAINFTMNQPGAARVHVYNRAGRIIREILDNRTLDAGANVVWWDGRDTRGDVVEDGLYIVSVSAHGKTTRATLAVIH